MPQTVVIIGANLAGGAAAITLREEGFAGKVILIGAAPHPPYERPSLSKKYLASDIRRWSQTICSDGHQDIAQNGQFLRIIARLAGFGDTALRHAVKNVSFFRRKFCCIIH
jgi:2-polyprenyl-6-methoxyphenol hydroxylase-like FAD-dependent oxidoreductase